MRWLLLCCVLLPGLMGADIVQIGQGNVINMSLPFEPVMNYSYSQQIYYASEIGGSGNITSIAFRYQVVNAVFYENCRTLKVLMGNTSRTRLDSWMSPDSLQVVFDGSLTMDDFSAGIPGNGWMNITLQQPFPYQHSGHLVIAVYEYAAGRAGNNDEFHCTQAGVNRGRVHVNANPIDVNSPPDSPVYIRQHFPNIKINIAISHYTPYQPNPVNHAVEVPISSGLSWSSDAQSWDLYMGSSQQNMQAVQTGLTQCQWNPPEPLQMMQTYYWQVIAHQAGQSYSSPVWNFTTAGETLSEPRYCSAWWQDDTVHITWQAPVSGNVQSYLVFRDNVQIAQTPQTAYSDGDVLPGNTYYYHVKARNHLGQTSEASNICSVYVPAVIPNLILWQGFDSATPFSTEIPGWQILDLDGSPTWAFDSFDFPQEGSTLGWMVFAPYQCVPPFPYFPAHSGSSMLMAPDAINPPDNNWLISPRINLGTAPRVQFWARSCTADYGLERLRVLISTQSSAPQDFIPLHASPYLAVPAAWTLYDYDLSAWSGSSVHLAWQSVSVDALALFLDSIAISGEGGYTGVCDDLLPAAMPLVYPNPSSGAFRVDGKGHSFRLSIYDIRGRKLYSADGLQSFDSEAQNLRLNNGIYLLRTESTARTHIQRLVVIK